MKTTALAIMSVLVMLALTASAKAAVIATDDFESDTVGLIPGGAGWIVSTTGAGAGALVANVGGAHDNVLEMLSNGTDDSAILWNYEPTASSAGGAIQFDMRIDSVTPSGLVRIGDVPNYGAPMSPISVVGPSARSYNYFTSPSSLTPGSTDNEGNNGYTLFSGSNDGNWHTFDVVVGPSSATGGSGGGGGGTEQLYMDYVLVASGLYSSAPGYAVEFGVNTQVVTAHDVLIDNIKAGDTFDDVAPEPASLGLLAIGGVMLLRRRRAA